MGKSVQIVAFARPRAGFVRIEIDRSLTGTGHESYNEAPIEDSVRPTDVLARTLFETGIVQRVHIFSNVITIALRSVGPGVFLETELTFEDPSRVTMEDTQQVSTLRNVVEQLFVHYRPGVLPTPV